MKTHRVLVVLAVLFMGPVLRAEDWRVEQLNLSIPAGSWEPIYALKEIRITHNEGTQPFIFQAYDHDLPGDPAAPINKISTIIGSGEIHLQVGQPGTGNEGATDLAAIAIDGENITSVIEGIYITGDFLAAEAMTVDHVTGPIQVGGAHDRRASRVQCPTQRRGQRFRVPGR
jgi:hypothetical protein